MGVPVSGWGSSEPAPATQDVTIRIDRGQSASQRRSVDEAEESTKRRRGQRGEHLWVLT